jgi:hypothetical protein
MGNYSLVLRCLLLDQCKLSWSVCIFEIPQIDAFVIWGEKILLVDVEREWMYVTLRTILVGVLALGWVLGFADVFCFGDHESVTSFEDSGGRVDPFWLSVLYLPETNFLAIRSEQRVLCRKIKPQQLRNHVRNLLAGKSVDLTIMRLELHQVVKTGVQVLVCVSLKNDASTPIVSHWEILAPGVKRHRA